MEVSTAKLISMVVLGLGSFLAGMLPATFTSATRQRYPLFVSCLLCFGGGVLLSTSLVHMLPEAREKLPENTELLFCVGFFVVYLVDELVHLFYGNQSISHGEATATYGSNNEQSSLLKSQDGEMRERCCGDAGNPRMCHVSHTAPCNKSASGIVGLLCALLVHSVLEGLAIGLQEFSSEMIYTASGGNQDTVVPKTMFRWSACLAYSVRSMYDFQQVPNLLKVSKIPTAKSIKNHL